MSLANNAPATQINYVRGVRELILLDNKLPQDYTVHQIKHFLVHLRDSGRLSDSSINLRVCGLKYYFRHVVNRLDLVVSIPNPRIAKYHTEVLDGDEIKQLFNACRDVRQLLVIQLLFDSGMRIGELLPVSYFHVVFTLPHEINQLVLRNQRFIYNLLFESAWYVLNKFGRDKKWLGAQSAATMVLHTWGQNLQLHPHVHCIVPAGGLSKHSNWMNPRKSNTKFLYPILAMNKVYKAFFLKQLRQAIETGLLVLPADFPRRKSYRIWTKKLYQKEWVVYAKPPFSKVENVVKYLARYTHRVAITNPRILNITDSDVTFRYKDYRQNGKSKTINLPGKVFLKRFCLHILPHRFRKIRHYGFLANRTKTKSLHIAKLELLNKMHLALSRTERRAFAKVRLFGFKEKTCSCCGGKMIRIDGWERNKSPPDYLGLRTQ